MRVINTDKAPAAIGPYSQGIAHNGLLFISGQIPLNPSTGTVAGSTIEEQAHQVMENIGAILKSEGSGFEKVIKTTCLLQDMSYFDEFNKIYAGYFTGKPARSCFAVKGLPKNVLCEVEVIACE